MKSKTHNRYYLVFFTALLFSPLTQFSLANAEWEYGHHHEYGYYQDFDQYWDRVDQGYHTDYGWHWDSDEWVENWFDGEGFGSENYTYDPDEDDDYHWEYEKNWFGGYSWELEDEDEWF